MKYLLYIVLLTSALNGVAQKLTGSVSEMQKDPKSGNLKKTALVGVNIFWAGTTKGVVSDYYGHFSIDKIQSADLKLVVSYVGYKNDTIIIKKDQSKIDIVLSGAIELGVVEVNSDLDGSYISKMKPIKTEIITHKGLQKAACCNLAESFQNSATVTVSYADAVTGAKQIEMLGLSGIYSQILSENIPSIRGIASAFGLGFVPGPWMESIQVSKGTSSVINGYESITGQINVEYKKAEEGEKFYLNLFASDAQRLEANANAAFKIKDGVFTSVLIHAEDASKKIDHNHDKFLDMPTNRQYHIMNRWDLRKEGKWEAKYGIKVLDEERFGGQLNFDKNLKRDTNNGYGVGIKTRRYEAFFKNGFLFPDKPYKSIGTILSGSRHEQDAFYGLNNYKAYQNTGYANFIWHSIIGNTNHKYDAGFSFMYDHYDENFNDSSFVREELIPGAFFQYTYNYNDVITFMAGIRNDYNSEYGNIITPRSHLKYAFNETTSFRISAGKGTRIPNPFAENPALLTTSRKWIFLENIKPEEAWNYGANLIKEFKITKRKATFSFDFYRTDFMNQLVVDMEQDAGKAYFYNLDGKSYANSLQMELTFSPIKSFDVTIAGKYNDVYTTINNQFQEKPFVNKYIGLATLSYKTKFDKWQFDFTTHLNGPSRVPVTDMMVAKHDFLKKESPVYFVLYAQITKRFKRLDVYLGGENLTNFIQKHPILNYEDPFGKHFDTSLVWGPIMGRKIYGGIRYKL